MSGTSTSGGGPPSRSSRNALGHASLPRPAVGLEGVPVVALDGPNGVGEPPTYGNPLEALLADWGKPDSPYDFNGDGTVGIDDMLDLLANWPHGPGEDQERFLQLFTQDVLPRLRARFG